MALGKFKEALTDFEAVKKVSSISAATSYRVCCVPLSCCLFDLTSLPPSLSLSPSKARPKDPDAQTKFSECNKIVRQQAFAKAIAVESSKRSVAETIDLDSMGKQVLRSCDL